VETELCYSTSVRNAVLFAIAWLGPLSLIVLFLRRIHVSPVIIFFLIMLSVPLVLTMLARPTWVEHMKRLFDRELARAGEGLERRPPPGFP
jgi:hypothetical protein